MKKKDDFFLGYVCATATLAYLTNPTDTYVKELMSCNGITWEKCLEMGVDDYDLKKLFPEEFKVLEMKRTIKDFIKT